MANKMFTCSKCMREYLSTQSADNVSCPHCGTKPVTTVAQQVAEEQNIKYIRL